MSNHPLQQPASEYCKRAAIDLNFIRPLGVGTDGAVWETSRGTAIKVFEREKSYYLEYGCYERFSEYGITVIEGLEVPQYIGSSDELLVIEMSMVKPPFLLDFAKVRIDRPPDFSAEVIRDAETKGIEEFGDNWWRVKDAMRTLESYGIYYLDPRPGNIMF